MIRPRLKFTASAAVLLLAGCTAARPPIPTVAHVDLARFMGRWYVIAATPTFFDENAYDAVESYRLAPHGTVLTTYTFHAGGFDGPVKTLRPRARVLDRASNARWGLQFLWPFRAQVLIAYLGKDYGVTVIARDPRDYVWIMARTPTISVGEYRRVRAFVGSLGYDVTKLRLYPQRWPAKP